MSDFIFSILLRIRTSNKTLYVIISVLLIAANYIASELVTSSNALTNTVLQLLSALALLILQAPKAKKSK